ncbi:hypothetical protein ACOMHN_007802 [Nucella lapillus]
MDILSERELTSARVLQQVEKPQSAGWGGEITLWPILHVPEDSQGYYRPILHVPEDSRRTGLGTGQEEPKKERDREKGPLGLRDDEEKRKEEKEEEEEAEEEGWSRERPLARSILCCSLLVMFRWAGGQPPAARVYLAASPARAARRHGNRVRLLGTPCPSLLLPSSQPALLLSPLPLKPFVSSLSLY